MSYHPKECLIYMTTCTTTSEHLVVGCGPSVEHLGRGRKCFFFIASQHVRGRNQDRGLHSDRCGRAGGRERHQDEQEEEHLWAVCAALPGWAVRDWLVRVCGLCVCRREHGNSWYHPARLGTWTGTGSDDPDLWANQVRRVLNVWYCMSVGGISWFVCFFKY